MTLGSHQKTVGVTQSWVTPKWIIDALGPFDFDPCPSRHGQPWPCARAAAEGDGLAQHWQGRVWLNPPFDRYVVGDWINKLAEHGTGTALLHVRTEADWFEPVWRSASAILFLADRLYFHYPDGTRAKANSGAPACLVAFGNYDAQRILQATIKGYYINQWKSLEPS